MATKIEDVLRSIPSEEHRQVLVDFHLQMSTAVSDGRTSFASRFADDLAKFLGKEFTADERLTLYVLFLKHAIYLLMCQAIPVFLQVVKTKDMGFMRAFAQYLPVITPDELPRAKLEARN